MARPIPQIDDISKLADEIKPKESKSFIDLTVETIQNKSSKYFVLGTITVRPPSEEPKPAVIQRPEPYKPEDYEIPFLPSKPTPHPAKISLSSIPNPNPSITANMETSYPNYSGLLYNIPGYSAFQQVNYSSNHSALNLMRTEPKQDYKPFTITGANETKEPEEINVSTGSFLSNNEGREEVIIKKEENEALETKEDNTQKEQDFEENFTMKIIPPTSKPEASKSQLVESKINVTSLAQGSGGSVIIPMQINRDAKKKSEKYSLKTSIPISKIDMKCVSNPVDAVFQNSNKKPVFNPSFQKEIERPKVEIQSNIVIKPATIIKDTEVKDKPLINDRESIRPNQLLISPNVKNNNISTLINAAEVINKNDIQFRVPEPKVEVPKETKALPITQLAPIQRPMFVSKDVPPVVSQATKLKPMFNPTTVESSKTISVQPSAVQRPIFEPVSVEASKLSPDQLSEISRSTFNSASAESNKPNFPNKPPEGGFKEQKNLIFIQNQNPTMLLTMQPNPHVLIQRTSFESKNLQAPSRLSSQSKSEVIAETSSKVVALKRLHQHNGDERDFENMITENQIYGNKILVKEKSQAMQEEWKNKVKIEKHTTRHWKNKLKIDIDKLPEIKNIETTQEEWKKKAKVDKPTEQHWKNKLKIDIDKLPETKNVVLQPNLVYLSNVQFPGNLKVIKNNTKTCQTTESTKINVSPNENRPTTEVNIVNNNNLETNIIKKLQPHNVPINEEVHVLKSSNNGLQTPSHNNNKNDIVFQTNQKVIVTPQVVYKVPVIVTDPDSKSLVVKKPNVQLKEKKKRPKLINNKPKKVVITCKVDENVPKFDISDLGPKLLTNTKVLEEVSVLDIYENKKRLRRLKYLSNTNKDVPSQIDTSPAAKTLCKVTVDVITPKNMKKEIFKELSKMKEKREEHSSDSESSIEEDELDEYNDVIEKFGANYNENAKADFLAGFSLASRDVFREKQLERHERTLKFDAIASAYIAARGLDPLLEDRKSLSPVPQTLKTVPEAESMFTLQIKHQFLEHLNLMRVSQSYKANYEKTWREILRDKNRRYGVPNTEPFDPDGQLQMLTEINKSVNENNDLIKKRLDSVGDENSDIRSLAEKNFSELNRLSKMADQSVKLYSGKDTKKRDLNPGFDSENIKKLKVDQQAYLPSLIIPDISKIITPRTDQEVCPISSSQATSMDEPSTSASCGESMTKEVGCQADVPWQVATEVMDDFIKRYRKYEIARKKEMDGLQRSNTQLRVQCAHVTRGASRDSDRARALLAERQLLVEEEANLRTSLENINRAIDVVRNSARISLRVEW